VERVQVEKRKWDGRVSARDHAALVAPSTGPGEETAPAGAAAWFTPAGSPRERPVDGDVERLGTDELWVAVPGQWWVVCARAAPAERSPSELVLHAAASFEAPEGAGLCWVDLDLDVEVRDGEVELVDEQQFQEHARSMDYPEEVVRGAWSGIASIAARYTNREWPFDGWLERCLARARADGAGAGARP